jgi:predicted dehydrogenase
MFAENYPYMVFNQEMRRLYRAGKVGELRYAEGEYVHPSPAEEVLARSCGYDHWRNWIPRAYYCTHSLAPIMYITDTRPVQVNALIVPHDFDDPALTMTVRRSDTASVTLCRMSNGAVAKIVEGSLRGHGNFVRIHGNRGLMENARHGDKNRLRIWREPWDKERGEPVETVYIPDFPEHHELARRAGHGGGDFFTLYHFAQAIRTGEQPYLNVYRAIDMSIVGVLAYRSALLSGAPVEVPDFRDESERRQYEDDRKSPNPATPEADRLPSSILGEIEPSPEARAFAKEVWASHGYYGE